VLVNYGERDWSKFLELIGVIQNKVYEMFGVRLEAEVNML
jgi:UDP-N-acetylenolpyruvoylglucosamine reductase